MALEPHEILGTYLIRGVPSIETLSTATEGYDNVVVFVDFNNIARGIYYPEITELIANYTINNNGQIPSILVSEWVKFQSYFESWANNTNKKLKCFYFSEHGNSFYHKNLLPAYKANRDNHCNITIPTGLLSYFDNDTTKLRELMSGFMSSTWEWIRKLASQSNIGTFRLSNLDADFIPEYMFRKVDGFYNDKTCYLILSSDGDMIQLLDFADNVKIIDSSNIITEKNWMTSKKYLEKDLSGINTFVRADRILLYKATVGDSSDGIKGIPKLGGKGFAKDLIDLPEEINCDDLIALKSYYTNKLNPNSSIQKIVDNWDTFELGIKLTSFKQLIEYLYHINTRNDLLVKMLNENNDAITKTASLLNIMVEPQKDDIIIN